MKLIAIVAFITLAVSSGAFAAEKTDPKAERYEICRQKLIKLQKLGVLYNLDWKPGKEPYVVAGSTFKRLPIDGKEEFAKTVNCFLWAGDTKLINFDILDNLTGKPLGRFSYGKFKME